MVSYTSRSPFNLRVIAAGSNTGHDLPRSEYNAQFAAPQLQLYHKSSSWLKKADVQPTLPMYQDESFTLSPTIEECPNGLAMLELQRNIFQLQVETQGSLSEFEEKYYNTEDMHPDFKRQVEDYYTYHSHLLIEMALQQRVLSYRRKLLYQEHRLEHLQATLASLLE